MTTTVLISGAGIAGPALAFWLRERGFVPTVVERAPALREGGSAVDFRGEQMALLKRMGILEDVRAKETAMGAQVIVDSRGKKVAEMPSVFFSGEVEIERGDLTRILYEHTKDDVEYVFGDWITGLDEVSDGVDVTFARGDSRRFDLVVGADGLHSGVRRLAFGDEELFRTDLGFHTAGFTVPNHLGLDHLGLICSVPGRTVMLSSGRDSAVLNVGCIFASGTVDVHRRDVEGQKRLVAERFADFGWEVPVLLEGLEAADDLYFDSLSQIHLDKWSRGRIVLLGDAAYCAGPGGSGTGLAMMGAYILAGELAAARGDHEAAFARYEEKLRGPVKVSQKQAAGIGTFLVPKSRLMIGYRNFLYRVLGSRPMTKVFTWLTSRAANAVTLENHDTPVASRR
ncbi:FAD-dependent monooxygenase [Amycolatopsis umgeniensis]|uniref:2-polyprenyl-6-methoxyphenol hydroxylase-like FAD-dependent oxidoreductase n=1 Tax=Amycolatopsis umgeniensis TaxID=336628 RepID=A0A841B5N5_9PSEU|nr:FAD-dependent monooxygenase [Amycolatopsis umgeniensis]MBB5854211.1 2-polyprenyl-6-methoxyphenol hydroxylase-like FAD-dependent oxidoreductase [Amycolatopsis umgeniensis]